MESSPHRFIDPVNNFVLPLQGRRNFFTVVAGGHDAQETYMHVFSRNTNQIRDKYATVGGTAIIYQNYNELVL